MPAKKVQESYHAVREADNNALLLCRYQSLRGSLGDLLRMITGERNWSKYGVENSCLKAVELKSNKRCLKLWQVRNNKLAA